MLLLTSNTTPTAVTAAGTINLGSAIHGCGRAIRLENGVITLTEPGYYFIDVSASVAVTGTGAEEVQLNANGVAIAGASASATPAEAGAVVNVAFPWILRKEGCCPVSLTLTAGAAGTVNDVTVAVRK